MPERTPSVSVAMINYNYGRYLCGALDSIRSQTRPVDQVVVVDDGSTDESMDVLAAAGDLVTVIRQPNSGAARASQRAIAACTGDVVLMLDSDDLMLPDRVERVVEAYRAHPQAEWVWHALLHVDRPSCRPLLTTPVPKGFTAGFKDFRGEVSRGRLPMSVPATSALSWRRDLLRRLMPIPAGIHVHDNYLKIASLGLGCGVVLSEVLALQGIHGDNVYTNVDARRRTTIRSNTAVDIGVSVRRFGLDALAHRMVAEGIVRSVGGRLLWPDRRLAAWHYVTSLSRSERRALGLALGIAAARVARERVPVQVHRTRTPA
jgi:glycosyltransferase involved in cell wall biosynthesis